MLINFFTQNNKIVGWTTGDAIIKDCVHVKSEITEADFKKIENWDWIPSFNADKLVLTKSQKLTDREEQIKNKELLKLKFQSGDFINEDIKKLAEYLL